MDDLFRLLRHLYYFSLIRTQKGYNGKQCAMKSRFQLKRFPSPAIGNRALDSLIIKPALNPHSATGRIERQRDRATANQRDGQIIREREREKRERERETERERDENSFTYTAANSLLNFSNQLFCSCTSFFENLPVAIYFS